MGGITLTVTDDSRLDQPELTPGILLTVIGNLIDNAIVAVAGTPQPHRIDVSLGYDGTHDEVIVAVHDTGPGVPQPDVKRIFQDGFTTKTTDGGAQRGLGLALVHRLITQRGGQISVTGGPGATFTVRLPAEVRLTSAGTATTGERP
jgi:two-component system CitB family sensor kinase